MPDTTERLWHLYVLDCDGRLYTGITPDVARRLETHRQGGPRAARFTRGARHITLVRSLPIGCHRQALKAEYRLKQQRRHIKIAWLALGDNDLRQQLLPDTADPHPAPDL